MLFGSYFHNLDDKGRLLIPSKLFSSLSSKLYLLKGFDGCLSLFCEKDFEQFVLTISSHPFFEKESRDFQRIALSSVVELEIDSSRRITIPTETLKHYGIGKKVVVIGVIDHLEIWDENKWNEYQNEKEKVFEIVSETLNKHE